MRLFLRYAGHRKLNLFTPVFLIIFIFAICFFSAIKVQSLSADAIAIRIIPNPEHYSASRWYKMQNFIGSPQSMIVDGYEAIRDGRTVYVNVVNVDDRGTATISDDEFYTNIYLISFNQDAETVTHDIFGQILKHWKFNTNINQPGLCVSSGGRICIYDSDCQIGEYCSSLKARLSRDARRMADVAEIKKSLEDYKKKSGYFPRLASGTYLPGKTLSVWPSWAETLSDEVGINFPVDPINKLGECEGFDKKTCWNKESKSFATDIEDNRLPPGSRVYYYRVNSDGTFSCCAQMETDYNELRGYGCF